MPLGGCGPTQTEAPWQKTGARESSRYGAAGRRIAEWFDVVRRTPTHFLHGRVMGVKNRLEKIYLERYHT